MTFEQVNNLKKLDSKTGAFQVIPCIYIITNNLNGNFYIGQTIDFVRRIKSHCYGSKLKISIDIKKNGKENFDFSILLNFTGLSMSKIVNGRKNIIYYEQKLINKLNPYYNEYKI